MAPWPCVRKSALFFEYRYDIDIKNLQHPRQWQRISVQIDSL